MLDFLFSPVMNITVGLLSGVVCTTLIAETYFKDKLLRERSKRVAAEEKVEVLRSHLEAAKSELYLSSRKKEEEAYIEKMTAYRKEINRKPMVFETVEQDGKIIACTGRLN